MKFLLQTKENSDELLDIEQYVLKNIIDSYGKYVHSYQLCSLHSMKYDIHSKDSIPVGSLEFVGSYLKNEFGVENLNPIEVPECLRKSEFLGRNYSIVYGSAINTDRRLFIKNCSKLKEYSNALNSGYINPNGIEKDKVYVVSSLIDIACEYRVFVYMDEIIGINRSQGDPLYVYDPKVISKMVNMYSVYDRKRPTAYTLDIAVTTSGQTVIIEIHPFVSCGTYGFSETSLLNMYRLGLDYYINNNIAIKLSEDTNEWYK